MNAKQVFWEHLVWRNFGDRYFDSMCGMCIPKRQFLLFLGTRLLVANCDWLVLQKLVSGVPLQGEDFFSGFQLFDFSDFSDFFSDISILYQFSDFSCFQSSYVQKNFMQIQWGGGRNYAWGLNWEGDSLTDIHRIGCRACIIDVTEFLE